MIDGSNGSPHGLMCFGKNKLTMFGAHYPFNSSDQLAESKALMKLSFRTRINFLADISALLPILLQLGMDGVDKEIYYAVHNVTAWWP